MDRGHTPSQYPFNSIDVHNSLLSFSHKQTNKTFAIHNMASIDDANSIQQTINMMQKKYYIHCKLGKEICIVPILALRMDIFLKTMHKNDASVCRITVSDTSAESVRLVIKWMTHHYDDWMDLTRHYGPVSWTMRTEFVTMHDSWDQIFFGELSMAELMELATTARRLQVEIMMQAVCRYISTKIRGLSEEQIRINFGRPQMCTSPTDTMESMKLAVEHFLIFNERMPEEGGTLTQD